MKFKHPVDTMSIENLLQNKIKYNSLKGTKVVMPYKGTIKDFDSNTCNGKLEIKHKIDGKKYTSVLCGVESVSTVTRSGLTRVQALTRPPSVDEYISKT